MNLCHKNNKACLFFLIIGIGLAFFNLTPQGVYLEEEFGLPILFKMRGAATPPSNIVIVNIDEISARILRLPDNPEKWPRSYYAQLINKINRQSPAVIAFNMTFGESRGIENDQLLAQAMVNGNNTILSNRLIKRKMIPATGSFNDFKFERIIDSIPLLEEAALATAPLLLPKTASTVKQFWVYRNSAGDIATFPTTVFEQYLLKLATTEITGLLQEFNVEYKSSFPNEPDPHFDQDINLQEIKTALTNDAENIGIIKKLIISKDFSAKKKRLLTIWLNLLEQPDSLYLNYYGGAETFPTIPFYQALASDILNPDLFKNKIVLVGYSKTVESSGMYTVFSDNDSDSTSPIEIAATAVANLLDNAWLKPLQPIRQFLLIIGWSILLSAISRFFSYKKTLSLLLILALVYLAISYMQFVTYSVWIPLFIALAVQIPLMVAFISIAYFLREKQEHQNMQQAFGLYVPDNVVASMARQQHDIKTMNHFGEFIQGVCMSTDAGQYTSLSENMEPQKLHHFINQYYGVMFPLVKKHKGIISDVVGDAMFAIWNATDQKSQARTDACFAALKIKGAVEHFNRSQPHQLPTRLGLNFGNFRLGNVGAAEHYEYRAVGDTVNTATRIEGLNKLLGTQILVTSDVIAGLQHFLTREIGFFILAGKVQSVHIFELISATDLQDPQPQPLLAKFSAALKLFQRQQWTEALAKWLEIEQEYPNDGPTLFYIQFLKQNLHLMSTKMADESQPTIIKIGNITTPLLLGQ
jgi:adenylate cyclase